MKGKAHSSPFAALSFLVRKKVPIYCWVDKEKFPVVGWRSPGSISRPFGDILHHYRAFLTTRLWRLSVSNGSAHQKRKEWLDESTNVQTTPTRTDCKRSKPLPYHNPNCRTPRHWKLTQHHRTTRPPLLLWQISL